MISLWILYWLYVIVEGNLPIFLPILQTKIWQDIPIYAKKVAEAIQNKECDSGILVCRSGYGMTVVANKFKGIRAAAVMNEESAKFAKADDDINVITLGGDYLTTNEAICIIRNWLATEFKGGRYEERLKMVEEIEKNNMK